MRALSLLVQAPSRSAPGAAAAELPYRGSYAYQRAAESGPPYGQLTRAEQRAGDQVGDRACQPDHYQARLGQMSDGDLAAEVSRGRQADREQRHRQQMREAGSESDLVEALECEAEAIDLETRAWRWVRLQDATWRRMRRAA